METAPQSPQVIQFSREFTNIIEQYIATSKIPTVKAVAKIIGVDVFTLWQWANKKKKDENGNIIDELARPNFHTALSKVERLEKLQKVKRDEKLNEKQEAFCKLYTSATEFFGNGVQAYIEVYEPEQSKPNWYKIACQSASQILSNINVCNRINELLEEGGLNDQNVDKQLLFLINQFEDKTAKISAIREYNKLKARITDKLDLTTKGKQLPTPIYAGKSTD